MILRSFYRDQVIVKEPTIYTERGSFTSCGCRHARSKSSDFHYNSKGACEEKRWNLKGLDDLK